MRIRVPASIANLGPGFDVLAMAVDLWLEVEVEAAERPEWEFEGEGAELLRAGPNPLSVLPARGWVRNQIPVGVGLGSSAAARVAAAAIRGSDDPIGEAGRAEGHYDNVAAAVMGGVVAVVDD
ncbi:MAG TPA: homoserine kinase, partial [Candidatus Dormibacteraeota bacterium]|nr:homoserine kinase [Candidatus Dormibacteraeota bacterium]